MFNRLFALFFLMTATLSASMPARAATEPLSIACEAISPGYIYCQAPYGYRSYTWIRREAPWSYTYTWTTTENYINFGCEIGHGQYVHVTAAGESSPTQYLNCDGGIYE